MIPPLAAILVTGIGLGIQKASIHRLSQENEVLRKEILTAKQGGEAETTLAAASPSSASSQTTPKKIHWKNLAARMAANLDERGPQNIREMLALKTSLMAMSPSELMAALDEIAALDLPQQVREELEYSLIETLGEKDPKLLLDRYTDQLQGDGNRIPWALANAFKGWTKNDPAAAMAWLDLQLQEGKFEAKTLDERNSILARYESSLVNALLSRDPATAQQRVAGMSETDRKSFFQSFAVSELKPGSEKAFADLFRNNLPPKEQASQLANSASSLVYRGYDRVGDFITKINASENERNVIVSRAVQTRMNQLGPEDDMAKTVEQARAWATQQSPTHTDQITGTALGRAASQNFEEASKLAQQYHETTGNDDVLVGFIESRLPTRPETLEPLLERISDPQRKEEIRRRMESARKP